MISLTGQKEAHWSDTITFRGDSITYRFVADHDGEAETANSLVTGDAQVDDWGFRFTVSATRQHLESSDLTLIIEAAIRVHAVPHRVIAACRPLFCSYHTLTTLHIVADVRLPSCYQIQLWFIQVVLGCQR